MPLAKVLGWYRNSVGANLRKVGLRFDDLLNEADPAVALAISRLSPEEYAARNMRMRRAIDMSYKRTELPPHIQELQEPFKQYLTPLVEEAQKELSERKALTGRAPSAFY